MGRNFRKRSAPADDDADENKQSDDEEERRLALEEIKFLQKQRQRKSGIPALTTSALDSDSILSKTNKSTDENGGAVEGGPGGGGGGGGGDGENDDWALTRTFAEEANVPDEDPNMLIYIEGELAKRKGKKVEVPQEEVENELQRAEDELYKIPEHLKVKKRNSEESSTQWTTGIAEVQLPIE